LLAWTYVGLGHSLNSSAQPAGAEDAYRQASAFYEKLTDRYPDSTSLHIALYDSYRGLVRRLEQTERFQEAATFRGRALDFYAKLVAAVPAEPAYQEQVMQAVGPFTNLLTEGGEGPEKEAVYRGALELMGRLAAKFPAQSGPRALVAYWHNRLGGLLTATGRAQEAEGAYRQAATHYRTVLELQPDRVSSLNNLAWLMCTCPDPRVRDAAQALELAKKATGQAPQHGFLWNTLGLAHYRAGDWKAAVAALEKSMALYARHPPEWNQEAFSTFVLAMAHWQLGNPEEARRWYERAVGWMEKYHPRDEELRRFRAEAAALIGP
jgi:tetratricopeptide (TPR) repeat protein